MKRCHPPDQLRAAVQPFAILLSLAALTSCGDPLPSEKSRPLFNGRDLSGWTSWLVDTKHEDPRKVFSVVGGILRCSGDGLGYLATHEEFSNYRLRVEWRWGSTNFSERIGKARDSGIFLHAVGPHGNSEDGNGAFMAALECNLFQGASGDLLVIRGRRADGSLIAPRVTVEVADQRDADGWYSWRPGGATISLERWGRINWREKDPGWRDVWNFRGARDVEAPPGEWNVLECEARGDLLRFHLNGVLVNEARSVWPSRGRILLQCEGSEIHFRRVDLLPLKD